MEDYGHNDRLGMTTSIVIAYIGASAPNASEIGATIHSVYNALSTCGEPEAKAEPTAEYIPAVDPKKSVKPGHIISLLDGKPYKSLKRHLSANGLTPDQYRERYGLKASYPMVCTEYSEARRAMAKTIGLGRKSA